MVLNWGCSDGNQALLDSEKCDQIRNHPSGDELLAAMCRDANLPSTILPSF